MSLQHIILGLLKLRGSQSGYDLKQMIDKTTNHFWYCDLSQIYRALDAISNAGWTTVTEDENSNRQRKIYSITLAGEEAFQQWLAGEWEREFPRHADLARLFFGRFGSTATIRAQVFHYRQEAETALNTYQSIQKMLRENTDAHPVDMIYWLMTLDRGVQFAQAYLTWCENTLRALDRIDQINSQKEKR